MKNNRSRSSTSEHSQQWRLDMRSDELSGVNFIQSSDVSVKFIDDEYAKNEIVVVSLSLPLKRNTAISGDKEYTYRNY
ncbi:hypothetical protein KPH14_011219 [Odynerus spinipes]|uniref:Uncharacterized protein n=1 Tax=Odynerus spinipes TaxID=1348599 RepID=A0AAD9VI71_9HYME|nr:hypothetical protein KPH14_011219 [Odynerus spinipes]